MFTFEARDVGVAWVPSMPVLQNVSFVLTPGFYGLVGANGAGKTTLLRVLAGELAPHEGSVRLRPPDGRVVHCPQAVDEPGRDVFELAGSYESLAADLRGRLALEPGELERWPTLSPGERKRWQIAAALASEPDVLLLDEPTNHLDPPARTRLLATLERFRGIGVIVSHERAVLDRLPRGILRVHAGTIALYPGRWSEAREAWETERRHEQEAHAEAKATVRALERRLDSARRTQTSAARSTHASARIKGPKDHDARSMGAKVVAGWAEGRAGRTVRLVRGELQRAKERVPTMSRDATLGNKVFATYQRAPHPVLFHVDAPELRAGDQLVLRDVRLVVGRQERVRITGDNGAGKTTLLRALVDSKPDDQRLLVLPQELSGADVRGLVDGLQAMNDEERGRVLSAFGALGSDPARLLGRRDADAAALSPGEARKLALAMGLGRHAWALVLDEPTNHLDLPTIERLEQALAAYPGCVVLVSHDDTFASTVTTRTVRVVDGRVA